MIIFASKPNCFSSQQRAQTLLRSVVAVVPLLSSLSTLAVSVVVALTSAALWLSFHFLYYPRDLLYIKIMNLRQKIQSLLILFLIFVTFASYHQGSTAWLQYLSVVTILAFVYVFDLAFANDSQFIFDPDAENWRRKTVRAA